MASNFSISVDSDRVDQDCANGAFLPGIWPLTKLGFRDKRYRVARDKERPVVADYEILGHLVTS